VKAKKEGYVPHGVVPACLLPFKDNLSIDEAGFRRHIKDLASIDGVTGIVVNGHASEAAVCSIEEQRLVVELAVEAAAGKVAIVSGIYTDSSVVAAKMARLMQDAGADGLLVFPTTGYISAHPAPMVIRHYRHIAEASDLPLTVFQYPEISGHNYPLDTLIKLAEAVPTVRAVKDNSRDIQAHERIIHALNNLASPVNVLTTQASWLLSTLVMGSAGIISGSGSVLAKLQVDLWRAVQAGDLHLARAIGDRIHIMTSVLYAEPRVDQHNRMKEVLAFLGKIPKAVVRAPLGKLSKFELDRIHDALIKAGMLTSGSVENAA